MVPLPLTLTTVGVLVECIPFLFRLVPMQEIVPSQSTVLTLDSVSVLVTVKGGSREDCV